MKYLMIYCTDTAQLVFYTRAAVCKNVYESDNSSLLNIYFNIKLLRGCQSLLYYRSSTIG